MTDDESMRFGKGHTPAQVYAVAEAHDGRYLLRGRFHNSDDAIAQRAACEALVESGHARWLAGNMAPGIRLTGKPFDVDTPAPPVDRNR
jgi:hypothetical protein